MIILGIDPGIAIVGYGIIECLGNHFSVIDYGVITTDSKIIFPERLKLLFRSEHPSQSKCHFPWRSRPLLKAQNPADEHGRVFSVDKHYNIK